MAEHPPGYRSLLWFAGGGGGKPPSVGVYGAPVSLLAFWIGGANWHYIPAAQRELIIGEGGLPYSKRRPPVDDQEILEFLQAWTVWQDVE